MSLYDPFPIAGLLTHALLSEAGTVSDVFGLMIACKLVVVTGVFICLRLVSACAPSPMKYDHLASASEHAHHIL